MRAFVYCFISQLILLLAIFCSFFGAHVQNGIFLFSNPDYLSINIFSIKFNPIPNNWLAIFSMVSNTVCGSEATTLTLNFLNPVQFNESLLSHIH